MFGLFGKTPPPSRSDPDHVYLSSGARADALVEACRQASPTFAAVVLVSPFHGHLPALRDLLQQRGLEVALLDVRYRDDAAPDGVPLVDASSLSRYIHRLNPREPWLVLQTERHPLRAHDQVIDEAVRTLPEGSRLRPMLSLDDGIFQIFGSGLQELCRKLDVPAHEAIEHPMVTRSIENAQQKLKQRVQAEQPADTFAQWRERNLSSS